MKIDEIAAEIGYANEGYFYKCFKQRYGSHLIIIEKNIEVLNKRTGKPLVYI